jgi:hypothetical protein
MVPGNLALVLAVVGLAVGLLGLAIKVAGRKGSYWYVPPRTVLIVVLAVAPAMLVVLYSWFRVDILGGGNIIGSWPAMALAIGSLVTVPPKPLRLVAVILTLAAFAIGGFKMLGSAVQRPDANSVVAYIDRVGTSGDPIVSLPYFHNPISELDVALADAGQSQRHPVIRLAEPSLAEQLPHLAGPHPQPVFFTLPVASPQSVANQAVALARHGTIFLVAPSGPVPLLLKYFPSNPISLFYRALPPRFHVVQHMTFPGFSGLDPESVYVFRDTGSTAQP